MKERDIFLAALAIASRDERDAFLAEVCAEPGRREQIQALLDVEANLGVFLESPTRPTEPLRDDAAPGAVIGAYKLLEEIGEGGMGAVWMAEQTEPVRRRVAMCQFIAFGQSRDAARAIIRRRGVAAESWPSRSC